MMKPRVSEMLQMAFPMQRRVTGNETEGRDDAPEGLRDAPENR